MDVPDYLTLIFLPFIISLIAVWVVHPYLVKVAKLKGIVDNPNVRKLQKEPVPVLGGAAVFFGVFIGLAFASIALECSSHFILLAVMLLMLYLGSIDDILNLRPLLRLLVQIIAVLILIYLGKDYEINNMLGWCGVYALPKWFAVVLTIFASVGIINAINLIDGVDGLSSGFGIMACLFFSMAFWYLGDLPMVALCASLIGALSLFFLHNVFGKKSKMFIGDGGTLVLGIAMSAFVGRLLSLEQTDNGLVLGAEPASIIPFTLAVLSIPVFDTLRVMSTRILNRQSPFHPDKTHLHHLFIGLGFAHAITTSIILFLNILIVLAWWLMYYNGVSAEIQTLVVIFMSVCVTFGLYYMVQRFKKAHPKRYARIVKLIRLHQPRKKRFFLTVQNVVDSL